MISAVTIRPINKQDTLIFFQLIERNRQRLQTYFPETVKNISDIVSAKKFIDAKIAAHVKEEGYYYVIEVSGILVGMCSARDVDRRTPKAELAYFIDKEYEGKGITSAALKLFTNFCFGHLGLIKIFARVNPANTGSRKVLEKNGFFKEALLKKLLPERVG